MVVCAILCLAWAAVFEQPLLLPSLKATGIVLWTGVMGGLVAYLLMVLGQRHTPPVLAGVLMNLEGVFALATSMIVGYDVLTVGRSPVSCWYSPGLQ